MAARSLLARFFMDHKASNDWAARRRIIYCALIWEAVMQTMIVTWSMFHLTTNPLLEMAFINLNGLFAGIFASYVFGPIWQKKIELNAGNPPPPAPPAEGDTNITVTK